MGWVVKSIFSNLFIFLLHLSSFICASLINTHISCLKKYKLSNLNERVVIAGDLVTLMISLI